MTNSVVEYESLAIGIGLARRVGAKILKAIVDSQLVARQIRGDYEARNLLLKQYREEVAQRVAKFPSIEVSQIPR